MLLTIAYWSSQAQHILLPCGPTCCCILYVSSTLNPKPSAPIPGGASWHTSVLFVTTRLMCLQPGCRTLTSCKCCRQTSCCLLRMIGLELSVCGTVPPSIGELGSWRPQSAHRISYKYL